MSVTPISANAARAARSCVMPPSQMKRSAFGEVSKSVESGP